MAFDAGYKGGVSVAAGDLNADGYADIVVGSLRNGNHVRAYSGRDQSELASFFAYDSEFAGGGISVAAFNADSDGVIDIGVGSRVGSRLKAFRLAGLVEVQSFFAFETEYPGGISVASSVRRPVTIL